MKITNVILAILLLATTTQAQNPLIMNADSILASTSVIPFSNPESADEFVEKGGDIAFNDTEVVEEIAHLPEEKAAANFVFFCYPSMFTTELFVTTDLDESSEIQLVNEAGQVVFKHKTDGIIENEKFTIPSILPAGTYFLKVKDNDAASVKLMKRS